jgi:hypothetical protein
LSAPASSDADEEEVTHVFGPAGRPGCEGIPEGPVMPTWHRPMLGGDPDLELGELAPDPEASPLRVLYPHPQDQLMNFLADWWPTAG